jgi:ATP/maltotriose-dependent transcriptional regulator MalT
MDDLATAESQTTDVPDDQGISLRELTEKATWHLASLSRLIGQLQGAAPETLPAEFESEEASQLTKRERQVLGLLIQGKSNRLIARTLRISESTVKNHLHAIFLKLDVADRTQAIAVILGNSTRR